MLVPSGWCCPPCPAIRSCCCLMERVRVSLPSPQMPTPSESLTHVLPYGSEHTPLPDHSCSNSLFSPLQWPGPLIPPGKPKLDKERDPPSSSVPHPDNSPCKATRQPRWDLALPGQLPASKMPNSEVRAKLVGGQAGGSSDQGAPHQQCQPCHTQVPRTS